MRLIKIIAFILFVPLLTSCESDAIYDNTSEVSPTGWYYQNPALFDFTVADTSINYDISLSLRIRPSYPFSNLFLMVHHVSPAGDTSSNRINLELAMPDGKWTGKTSGKLISYDFPILKNQDLKAGNHRFAIEQNMRTNTLENVVNIGLTVDKGERKF